MSDHETERQRQAEFARRAAGDPPEPNGARLPARRTFATTLDRRSEGKVLARIEAAIELSGLDAFAWVKRALDRTANNGLNQARQRERGE